MKRELVDAVVAAIDTLINDELCARDPGRYQRVAKLCGKANAMLQMATTRVGALPEAADIEVANGVATMLMNDDFNVEPIRYGNIGGGGNDMSELMREMITATQKFMEPKVPKVTPANELLALLDLRRQLKAIKRDVSEVDASIDRTLKRLNEGDADAVVRAELSRGHQAGVDHGQAVLPVRTEGYATRTNGARRAGHDGNEEEVAAGDGAPSR